MHQVKIGQLKAGIIKQFYRDTIDIFVASNNALFFINSVKVKPPYWKKFLYHAFALLKYLAIPTYFFTLLYPNLIAQWLN